ncbi:hypothetical protein BD560DRAFT_433964 [Blakeslea trispora]|nr:hypothetical protein BD560DRAFT_433964 [Blakeslea trispora]
MYPDSISQHQIAIDCHQTMLHHNWHHPPSTMRANQPYHQNVWMQNKLDQCSAYCCLSLPYSSPLPLHAPPPSPACSPNLPKKSGKMKTKTKRAEQNRAAQRAFRLRKERYIKELERKAQLLDEWRVEIELLRQENQQLREINQQIEQGQKQPMRKPILPKIPPPIVTLVDPSQFKKRKRSLSFSNEPNLDNNQLESPVVLLSSPLTSPLSMSTSPISPSEQDNTNFLLTSSYVSPYTDSQTHFNAFPLDQYSSLEYPDSYQHLNMYDILLTDKLYSPDDNCNQPSLNVSHNNDQQHVCRN